MNIKNKTVNNLRILSSAMISNAKSGHTGISLDIAPIMYSLYAEQMNITPNAPTNIFRDRFVLSAGHGSAILYATLYAMGFKYSQKDLKMFRKMGSITSGHPELNVKYGIECTTGPLGQGLASAVGMAIAEAKLESMFNRPNCSLFDYKTYVLCGEGCLMEGVGLEALSIAGNLNLKNLIVIYDSNKVSLDSSTDNTFYPDITKIVEGMGFNVFSIKDSEDLNEINAVLTNARKSKKPAFVIYNSTIGFGTAYENTNKAHGLVLSPQELNQLKQKLDIVCDDFDFENDVQDHLRIIKNRLNKNQKDAEDKLRQYKVLYKAEFKLLNQFLFDDFNKSFNYQKPIEFSASTRDMGGKVLNELSKIHPTIIGGSADTSSSTKAYLKDAGNITAKSFRGKNIFYGVREFAMCAISNGLALSGFKPFASTFLTFSDYAKSAIRSACLMKLPVTYVLSHDSLAVGEDGPTHQPIEQIASLRLIPNLDVFRPCNYDECVEAYKSGFLSNNPTAIILTRQNLKSVYSDSGDINKGAYIISKEVKGQLHGIIIATGSEVPLAVEAQRILYDKGFNVRIVSMPCVSVFERQPEKYRLSVLPNNIKSILTVEAGVTSGWRSFTGLEGACIGVDQFGDTGSEKELMEKYGITCENIVETMKKIIKANRSKTYSLLD